MAALTMTDTLITSQTQCAD